MTDTHDTKTGPRLPRLLPRADLDRRTVAYRRLEDLVAGIESDLGGSDRLSTAERQLAQRAATLCALAEDQETRFLAGRPVDLAQYATLVNSQLRAFAAIGIKRVARDCTPSLEQYLAQVNAKDERTEKP
jgi:hypothetical protein